MLRHALFQFFEPVEHDIELSSWQSQIRFSLSRRKDHRKELFSVRSNVVVPLRSRWLNDSCNWELRRFTDGERSLGSDIDDIELVVPEIEKLFSVR